MHASHALLLALTVGLAACSASSDDNSSTASLFATCDANLMCRLGSYASPVRMHRDANGLCMLGAVVLNADGTTVRPNGEGSWSEDGTRITICKQGACAACDRVPPKVTGGGTGCTGTPSSCSSQSPGYCSNIRGCRMSTRVRYNGSYENTCTGTPDDCDEILTEGSCREQGCTWR